MNKRAIRAGAVTAVGAAALVGAGIVVVSASGDTTAAPDPDRVGGITLQVNGSTVTSGHLTDAITAVGAANAALTGTKAAVFGYVHSGYAYAGPTTSADLSAYQPTAEGTWTGAQLTAAVDNDGLSVPLGSSVTLQQFLSGYTPAAGGLVELRLKTISPGAAISSAYDAVDIYVDSAAGTWSTTSSGTTGSPSSSPSTTSSTPTPSTTGSPSPTKSATTPPVVKKVAATVTLKVAKKVKHTAKAPVTVTVTASKTPTGTVTIFDGKKKLATKALSGGKASVKLTKLKKGKHKIKATYSGSTTVTAASSKTITVTSK